MDSYWRDREEQAAAEYALTDEQYVEELNDIYDYMLDQVKKEINGFYSKYATKEGITMAEAQKRVAQADIDEYQRKAKKYVEEKDFSAQANREMRLYNLTMKVNRLQMLEANIGLETVSGFDELSEKLGEDLNERAMREMSRQAGILGETVTNNAKTANSIVGASFHNATFSDRIWMYQAQLRDELDGLLRNGLIQGQNPNELARHINKLFDTGKYNCERLLRTELTRVQSDAQLQSFIENGFDEYQFNALGNACPDCRALDEQHFRIADAEPGENLPPIHPNCKCAVSAWMDNTDFDEWLDTYPDHGMDYQGWLENRPTDSFLQNKQYQEWMQDFLNGKTDMDFDEYVKTKQSGGDTTKKKTTAKKKTTTKKKAEPAEAPKKKASTKDKDELYDEWFDEYYGDKTDLDFEDWLEDRTGEKAEYRKFRSGDEADKYFRESGSQDDWEDYIEKSKEKDAIYGYTVADYEIINDRLRGRNLDEYTKEELSEAAKATDKISDAISKYELKDNIHVYRGCKDDALENLEVGDIYRDNGLMSTSTEKSAAERFLREEGGKMLEIDIPAGKGAGAWVRPVSEFADENEFLMQRYGEYLCVGKDADGTIHLQKLYNNPAA